ncbi:MAG: hypothetical protein M3X11_20450, partial [Acidobacteriota bacterium]|nr:hypothetical protein [Acidobacteriota bacterium]
CNPRRLHASLANFTLEQGASWTRLFLSACHQFSIVCLLMAVCAVTSFAQNRVQLQDKDFAKSFR